MSTQKLQSLDIEADLLARLSVLAQREGSTVSELAESVLRSHVDLAESEATELAEDERRWRHYLAQGESVPSETVQGRLRDLADEAARKAKEG